jgi:hypothetical protein
MTPVRGSCLSVLLVAHRLPLAIVPRRLEGVQTPHSNAGRPSILRYLPASYTPIQKENSMKSNTRNFVAIAAIGLALTMPINRAFAGTGSEETAFEESEFFQKLRIEWQQWPLSILSAEWWQWALSIPTSVNPQLETDDTQADTCMIGQRGPVWFLTGFFGGVRATRTCSVPEGKALFFPVINTVGINVPGVCGQTGNLTVSELRASAAEFINGAANLLVEVDHKAITNLRRVQSPVFAVTLPEENVFDAPCPSNVPAGVFSPAVADGYYVLLSPLPVGRHTLHFQADNPAGTPNQDVTYIVNVKPVVRN